MAMRDDVMPDTVRPDRQGRQGTRGVSRDARAPGRTADSDRLSPLTYLYMIALFTPILFNVGPLVMSPLRLLLLFVVPVLTLNLLAGKYGRVNAADILFMLYLLWRTVALVINNPSQAIEFSGSTTLEFFGGYLVARATIRSRAAFAKFCLLLGSLIILTLIPAILEQLTGRALWLELLDALPGAGSIRDISYQRLGLERVQVAFEHPILYGVICSTGLSLTFVALRAEISTAHRYLRAGLIAFAVFMSLSAAPLLAALLNGFMIGYAWLMRKVKRRWLILFSLFAVGYILIDLFSNRTPIRVLLYYGTFSAETAYYRLHIFDWGLVNVRANPVFGIGLNDWVRADWMYSNTVDNFWLVTAMNFGIPAFVFIISAYLWLAIRVARAPSGDDEQLDNFRTGWWFTMFALGLTLATVHVWDAAFSYLGFLLGMGAWLITAEPREAAEHAAQPGTPTRTTARNTARNTPRWTRFDSAENARTRKADGP